MLTYRNYDVCQSLDLTYWFALPIGDLTTERKIKAPNPPALKALINEAIADRGLNPWELPRRSAA
jgi:hypothetical protein